MPTKTELAKQFVDAQRSRDAAAIDSLAEHIADDAVLASPRGSVDGKTAIVDRLKNPPQGAGGGMMNMITWGDPVEEGEAVRITANVPPNPMVKGLAMVFSFAGDKIQKIDTQIER